MKQKKAELTSQQLVILIILIISFAVILFLIFRLNLGEVTDKEICHNSIVTRDIGKKIIGKVDCKVNYVCISESGTCEDFSSKTIKKTDFKNKNETYKILADEMADCWWMFGEGVIDYVANFEFGGVHCALCSSIKFGKTATGITYSGLYSFMEKTKKNEKQTYLEYLYNLNSSYELYKKYPSLKKTSSENNLVNSEKYLILTGRDNSFLFGEDIIYKVSLVKSGEKTNCTDFITIP